MDTYNITFTCATSNASDVAKEMQTVLENMYPKPIKGTLIYSNVDGGFFDRNNELVIPADIGHSAEEWEHALARLATGTMSYMEAHRVILYKMYKIKHFYKGVNIR